MMKCPKCGGPVWYEETVWFGKFHTLVGCHRCGIEIDEETDDEFNSIGWTYAKFCKKYGQSSCPNGQKL